MLLHRRLSIRGQLLLLVLTLGVPFLVFLLIATVRQSGDDRERVGQQMLGMARLTAARLDDHVGNIQHTLNVLSATVGMAPQDLERNDAILRSVATTLPPHVLNVAVWAADGSNLGALDKRVRAVGGIAARPFFMRALANGGLTVGAPVQALVGTQAVGMFGVQVWRDGRVVGIVALAADLRHLQSLLAPQGQVPQDGLISVSNEDGIVLARSIDADKWVGRSLNSKLAPGVWPGPVRGTASQAAASGAATGGQPSEGVRDAAGIDGVRRIAGFTTAQRVPWMVYVGVPEHSALAPVRERLYESLAVGGTLMALGLLLSAWVARRVSKPLLQLERDARRIGQGELAHRSQAGDGHSAGEVLALASTLNEMAATLQQRDRLLQESRAEFADLFASAPVGYHALDADGRVVLVNDTELRWLGYRRDEVVGRSVFDFLNDAGRQLLKSKAQQLGQDGHLKDLEFDLVAKDGTPRRVVASTSVVRGADGKVASSRTALYDITELQQLRGDVQRLSAEQQAVLDNQLIGIFKLKNRQVVWTNIGGAALFGYEPGEMAGLPMRTLYPDAASYETAGADGYGAVRAGRTFRRQLHLRRKDGTLRWFDAMGIPLPGSQDEAMALMLDITPLKEAEDARLRAMALEAQNRELTEGNRLKSLFLANMSHELHTPLNAVLGYAHLLGSVKPDSPKFAGYLSRIDTSGRQLLGLIDAMLNMAKAESGKLDLQPQPVSLQALLADVVALLQPDAARKQLSVTVAVEPTADAVVVDPVRLTQVVAAYLSNAIKFSDAGGAVQINARLEGDTRFRIEVVDNGVGIAGQDLPRLFVAFQQLSEGARKTHAGAGLGLALVKRLVEAQGGTVGVRSAPGEGSTFHLVLPTGR